jgi:hypothetical protein
MHPRRQLDATTTSDSTLDDIHGYVVLDADGWPRHLVEEMTCIIRIMPGGCR